MEIRTGHEVTHWERPGSRGVVVDGHIPTRGPNKGRIEVMWIGGRYMVSEWPEELEVVK